MVSSIRHWSLSAESVETLIVTVAALRLLEVPWYGSLVCAFVLAGLSFFGRTVSTQLFGKELELGTSFVIGCAAFVFLGQILLVTGVDYRYAHWLSIAIIVGVGASMRSSASLNVEKRLKNGTLNSLAAVSMGVLAVSIHQLWLLPFSVAVVVRALVDFRPTTNALRVFTTLSVVLGWIVSAGLRPDKWWYFYQGNDAQFFEAISWSIARWGVFEHPGYVGGSIANYHWFAYAFFGALSQVASLGPWVAIMNIGPSLIAVLLGSLFTSSLKSRTSLTPTLLVAVVLAVVASGITRADSLVFSFVVAFAILSVVSQSIVTRLNIAHGIFFSVLALTVMLSKVSTAAILLAVLVIEYALQKLRHREASFLVLFSFVTGYAATYVFLLRTNDPGMLREGITLDFSRSLNELEDLLEPSVTLNYILWVIVLLLVKNKRWKLETGSTNLSVFIVAPMGIVLHLLLSGKSTSYFAFAGIALVTFISLGQLFQLDVQPRGKASARVRTMEMTVLAACGVFGFLSIRILRRVSLMFDPDGRLGAFVKDTMVSGGFILILLMLLLATLLSRRYQVTTTASLFIALAILVGQSTNLFVRTVRVGPGVYTSSDVANSVFSTSDIVQTSNFIRSNTPDADVVASNQFCGVDLDALDKGDEISSPLLFSEASGECKWGGANYLLPAETRRRFLVQGLRFQLGTQEPSSEQLRRVVVSLKFANHPSKSSLEELRSFGVSGFIVNLSLTKERDWSDFAVERFRSGDFLYLQLK